MESPVSERMCKERHDNLGKKVDDIKTEVLKIRLLWIGNGKVGAGFKIDTMWSDHLKKQKSTQGWMDWGFRLIIITMLGFIMAHLGAA